MNTTRFRMLSESGECHDLRVTVQKSIDGMELLAEYESGTLSLPSRTTVARWPVSVSLPAGSDKGHVWIGNGRIDIDVPELRGLGLGSFFMTLLISWIKAQPNLPVVPIDLSVDDARTSLERDRRNRFYERFGFTFVYDGDREWGTSNPIHSHDLLSPELTFGKGWRMEKL